MQRGAGQRQAPRPGIAGTAGNATAPRLWACRCPRAWMLAPHCIPNSEF